VPGLDVDRALELAVVGLADELALDLALYSDEAVTGHAFLQHHEDGAGAAPCPAAFVST
jgi:hypothetical protein